MRSTGRELWQWRAVAPADWGLADSLDEAKAAFRLASDAGGLDRSECTPSRPKPAVKTTQIPQCSARLRVLSFL